MLIGGSTVIVKKKNGKYDIAPDKILKDKLPFITAAFNSIGLDSFNRNLISRLLVNGNELMSKLNIADLSKIKGASDLTANEFMAMIIANYSEVLMMNVAIEKEHKSMIKTFNELKVVEGEDISNFNNDFDEFVKLTESGMSDQLKDFMSNINFNRTHKMNILVSEEDSSLNTKMRYDVLSLKDFFTYTEAIGEMVYNQKGNAISAMYYLANKNVPINELSNHIYENLYDKNEEYSGLGSSNSSLEKNILSIINEKHAAENEDGEPIVVDTILFEEDGVSNSIFSDDLASTSTGFDIGGSGQQKDVKILGVKTLHGVEKGNRVTDVLMGQDYTRAIMDVFLGSAIKDSSVIALPLGFTSRNYFVEIKVMNDTLNIKVDHNDKIEAFNFNETMFDKAIEKNFYFYKAKMEQSHVRIINALEKISSVKLKEDLESLLGDISSEEYQENIIDILESIEIYNEDGLIINTEETLSQIQNSGLIKNVDYTIIEKDGLKTFRLGGDASFGVPGSELYSYDNLELILDKERGNIPHEIIEEIMVGHLVSSNRDLSSQFMDDDYGIRDYFSKRASTEGFTEGSGMLMRKDKKGDAMYNPVFQYLSYAYAAFMPQTLNMVNGSESLYSGMLDYNKRFDINKTPKISPMTDVSGGLGKSFKFVIREDSTVEREDIKEEYKNKKGVTIIKNTSVERNDGGGVGGIMFQLAMSKSYGGDMSIYDRTTYKPLIVNSDVTTGRFFSVKFGLDFVSQEMLDDNENFMSDQKLIEEQFISDVEADVMNSNGDLQVDIRSRFEYYYDQGLNFTEVQQAVLNEMHDLKSPLYLSVNKDIFASRQLRDAIISNINMGIMPLSSVKNGAHNIAPENASNDEMTSIKLGTENFGLIANFNMRTDSEADNAVMNQALAHIGVNNPDIAETVSNALSSILENGINDMLGEIGVSNRPNEWTEVDKSKFKEHLKKLAIKAGDSNTAGKELKWGIENGIPLDIPDISFQLGNYFNSEINKLVMPRIRGSRYVQNDGTHISVYRTSSGAIYSKTSAIRHGLMNNDGSLTSLGTSAGISKDSLKHMNHDNGTFTQGEVALAFVHAETFGIEKGEQVADGFTFLTKNGDTINLQPLIEKLAYLPRERAIIAIKNLLDEKFGNKISNTLWNDEEIPYFRVSEFNNYAEDGFEDLALTENMKTEMANYLLDYNESLEVVATRIPFDTPSLGFSAKVVQFIWGNGSTVYINPLENVRTGGDQDIDQLSIYFKDFSNDKNREHKNALVSSLLKYYSDERNGPAHYSVTGTDSIDRALDMKKKDYKYHQLSSVVDMNDVTEEGSSAIGIMAISSSTFAYLQQMNSSNDIKITEIMKGLTQAALDNKKKIILSRFGLPKELMGLLNGFSMNGKSYGEMVDLVKSTIGKKMFNEFRKGTYMSEKSKSFESIMYETKLRLDRDFAQVLESLSKALKHHGRKDVTGILLTGTPAQKKKAVAYLEEFSKRLNYRRYDKYKKVDFKKRVMISGRKGGTFYEFNNYAERPFSPKNSKLLDVYANSINEPGVELEFKTVQGALVASKMLYNMDGVYYNPSTGTFTEKGIEMIVRLSESTGLQAARNENKIVINDELWMQDDIEILHSLVKDSFTQNESAAKSLMDSREYPLDIKTKNEFINEHFSSIIMGVRDELLVANKRSPSDLGGYEEAKKISDEATKLISNIYKAKNYEENMNAFNSIEDAYISSTFLRDLSNIVKLRAGLPANNVDMKLQIRRIEESLGMTIQDYLSEKFHGESKIKEQNRKIRYYKQNSNSYATESEEETKAYLIDLKTRISKKGSIKSLLDNNPYFKTLLQTALLKKQSLENTLLPYNNVAEKIERKVANLQGKNTFSFAHQFSPIIKTFSELYLDKYLEKSSYKMTVGIPKETDSGWIIPDTHLINIDLSNTEQSMVFKNNFPALVRSLKQTLFNNSSYESVSGYFASLNIQLTEQEHKLLINSKFLDSIIPTNNEGFLELRIDPAISYDANTIEAVKFEFQKLPEGLRTMFELYHNINMNLSNSTRGLGKVMTQNVRIDMGKVMDDTAKQEIIDFISDDKDNIVSDYIGFDKNVRVPYDVNKTNKYVIEFDEDFYSDRSTPKMFTGKFNGVEPIYKEMATRLYKGRLSFDNKAIVLDIRKIKLGTVAHNEIKRKGSTTITTVREHNYGKGMYMTEYGEIVEVKYKSPTAIYVKESNTKSTDLIDKKYKHINNKGPVYLNFGESFTNILLDKKTAYRLLNSSTKSLLNNITSTEHAEMFYITKAERTYKVLVSFMGDLNPRGFKSAVNEDLGVIDYEYISGVKSGLRGKKTNLLIQSQNYLNAPTESQETMKAFRIELLEEFVPESKKLDESLKTVNCRV